MATKKVKLKVGLVIDTSLDPNDGVQQYVITVGEWLRKHGHDVHYLAGQTDQRKLQNIHSLARNVSVRFNGNRTTVPLPASRKMLRTFLAENNFDVLHVQLPHSPFMAQRLILAASKNTAIIGTFHIAPYSRMVTVANKALGYWLRPSLARFDTIVSVSSAAAEFAKSTFSVDTKVLPNVIEYDRFHNAQPFKEYQGDHLNILFLGRLVARKGCDVLLQAAAILNTRDNIPKFRLIICGKGHMLDNLQEYTSSHRLKNLVDFVGFVEEKDKPRFYASADIAVFPSKGGESFGIVLLEAMASGKAAVLAGNNPGYRTVLAPQPDLLFDPEDPQQLADKLTYYLSNEKKRAEMASWGSNYTKNFDVNIVGNQLLDIYYEALLNRSHQ